MIDDIAPRRSPSRSKISSASWKQRRRPRRRAARSGARAACRRATSPAATRCAIGMCAPPATCSTNHARTRPSWTTPTSRSAAARVGVVAELPRELDRRAGTPPPRRRGPPRAPTGVNASPAGRAQEVLAELHARGELGLRSLALGRELADLARELGGPVVLLGRAERRGAAEPHVELEVRIAERLGQRARARRAPRGGRSDGAACRARGRAPPAGRAAPAGSRRTGARRSTTRSTSSGAFAASALRLASIENRTHTAASPAAFAWWASSGRLSGRRARPTAGARRSRRGSPAAAPWVSVAGRELAHLLVREAVVGGRLLGVLGEQPGRRPPARARARARRARPPSRPRGARPRAGPSG